MFSASPQHCELPGIISVKSLQLEQLTRSVSNAPRVLTLMHTSDCEPRLPAAVLTIAHSLVTQSLRAILVFATHRGRIRRTPTVQTRRPHRRGAKVADQRRFWNNRTRPGDSSQDHNRQHAVGSGISVWSRGGFYCLSSLLRISSVSLAHQAISSNPSGHLDAALANSMSPDGGC